MVIYRDFKTSNLLLDLNSNTKLSDFGLARDGPTGDKSHVSTWVMGTYVNAPPEYLSIGHLTSKSDIQLWSCSSRNPVRQKAIDKKQATWRTRLGLMGYALSNQQTKNLPCPRPTTLGSICTWPSPQVSKPITSMSMHVTKDATKYGRGSHDFTRASRQ